LRRSTRNEQDSEEKEKPITATEVVHPTAKMAMKKPDFHCVFRLTCYNLFFDIFEAAFRASSEVWVAASQG
jgi:hypothetical protein